MVVIFFIVIVIILIIMCTDASQSLSGHPAMPYWREPPSQQHPAATSSKSIATSWFAEIWAETLQG